MRRGLKIEAMKAWQWASGGCGVTTMRRKKKKEKEKKRSIFYFYYYFFRTVRSRGGMRDETDEGFVLFEPGFGAGWAGSALEEKQKLIT